MEVSHIVTIGCSLTFCQGLPFEKSWPYLIAKQLNTNIVNLALPGLGNDGIHRKAFEYFYKNKPHNNLPLFIIGLSAYWRREIWYKNHFDFVNFNDYAPVAMPDDKHKEPYHETMLENWDEFDFLRRTNIIKLSLINLFDAHKIPYIITDMFPKDTDIHYEKKYKELLEAISVPNYIEPACLKIKHMTPLPCGHYSEDQCVVLKDFFIDVIKNLYPNLTFGKNKPYFTTEDYARNDKYHQKFLKIPLDAV